MRREAHYMSTIETFLLVLFLFLLLSGFMLLELEEFRVKRLRNRLAREGRLRTLP
jgi:hypothetical protein